MKSVHRAAGLVLGLVSTPAGASQAAAAPSTGTTWTLRDIGTQQTCVTSDFGHPGQYFLVPVHGTWTRQLTAEVRDLPPGSRSGTTPIAPGSDDDNGIVAGVHTPPAPAPVGVYAAHLWVSDGVDTRTAPITITVRERC